VNAVVLLGAVLALCVYPGGLALGALTVIIRRAWPVREVITSSGIGAAVALGLAAALVPLPGSPAGLVAGRAAGSADLGALLLVLAAAVGIGVRSRWNPAAVAGGAAGAGAIAAVAAARTTMSFPAAVSGVPSLDLTRAVAAVALLLGGALVIGTDEAQPRRAASIACAVLAEITACMAAPLHVREQLPWLEVAVVPVLALAAALLARVCARWEAGARTIAAVAVAGALAVPWLGISAQL
jgi:hypothetical protein